MPIKVQCPTCSMLFDVPDTSSNRVVNCPKCKAGMYLQGPTTTANASSSPSTKVEATKKCPICDEEVKASAKKCKHCGTTLDVMLKDIEDLKRQSDKPQQVFMNAGGGGGSSSAASSSSAAAASGGFEPLHGVIGFVILVMLLFCCGCPMTNCMFNRPAPPVQYTPQPTPQPGNVAANTPRPAQAPPKEEMGLLKLTIKSLDTGINAWDDQDRFIDGRIDKGHLSGSYSASISMERELSVGPHKITIKRNGILVADKEVIVMPKSEGDTYASMEIVQTGIVTLMSSKAPIQPGVEANIYVDGKYIKQWPVGSRSIDVSVLVGTRVIEVRVARPIVKVQFRKTVEITEPGKTYTFNAE